MASPVLDGERVRLRPVEEADAARRRRHGWHRAIERNYGSDRRDGPMSSAEALDWLAEIRARDSSTFWAVEVEDDLAGVAFLHHVREVDRNARYAAGMFHPRFVGRGLGLETTRLVLDHAFGGLGLHRVDLRVLAFNTAAIASYQRAGFVVEGRERDSCRLEGAWHDDVIMAVLEDEYRDQRSP